VIVKPISDPRLTDIRPEDLESPHRLHTLRQQAIARGWLRDCEADTLNFFAAAVRARSTPARDPIRVFITLVGARRWSHVTQAQEDEARPLLRPKSAPIRAAAETTRLGGLIRTLLPEILSGNGHITRYPGIPYRHPTTPDLPKTIKPG
jgi:hypothetical protein